ncbi:hypothetical protein LCGC14_2786160, partial [marine sediment metagenome]
MPENSKAQRRRILNRRQSVRLATGATRQAVAELPAHLSSKASGIGARPILKETTKFAALATSPNITFGVNQEGRLLNRSSIVGTARHEVAHLLGASPSIGAGHVAFRAGTGGVGTLSRQGVVSAVRAQREPFGRRIQRAATRTFRPSLPSGKARSIVSTVLRKDLS